MMSSIRGRVLLLVLLAQLLATACAVSIAVWYVHRALWSSADSEIQARAVALFALVGQADDDPYALDFDGDQTSVPSGDLYFIIDPRDGHALAGSKAWIGTPSRIDIHTGNFWTFKRGSTTYRAKVLVDAPILDQEDLKVPQLRATLYYAMPAIRTEAEIAQATRIAILVGILTLLVSAFFSWWAIGRGMVPLVELASRADRIQADRAEFEIPPGMQHSSELMPVGRAFQSLVARVRAAFDRERQFLSDAAHELKTAVAIQKSTLQLLEQGRPSETEYREGVARALEDTARMEQLVADMLLLSAIEHAQHSQDGPAPLEDGISLEESIQISIDRLQPLAQMKNVAIDFNSQGAYNVKGKEAELCVLWTNLIENAIQHSPPSSHVCIEVSGAGDAACRVRIVDSGSGIAPADLPHIFERFYRSDSSRSRATGGFGLGLSIAKAIVDAQSGFIKVESTVQHGTTIEVSLPVIRDRGPLATALA
jgi:signal transduction histidine kinase